MCTFLVSLADMLTTDGMSIEKMIKAVLLLLSDSDPTERKIQIFLISNTGMGKGKILKEKKKTIKYNSLV